MAKWGDLNRAFKCTESNDMPSKPDTQIDEWDTMAEAARFALEQLIFKGDKLADRIEDHDAAIMNLHREYERRGDTIAELEAKLGMIQDEWTNAVYGDLENGVASLNAAAATDFCKRYPLVSSFGETLNRIIDGEQDDE